MTCLFCLYVLLKANSRLAGHEMFCMLWYPQFDCRIQEIPSLYQAGTAQRQELMAID